MILKDSKAIEDIAKKNKNLATKIKEFIADFIQKIKKAFDGVKANSVEAKAIEKSIKDFEHIQILWDNALVNATEGYHAVGGNIGESNIEKGIKYSFKDSKNGMANDALDPYNDELTKLIKANGNINDNITSDDIETLRSIGRKSVNDFTSEDIKKAERIAKKYFKELGVKSPFFRAWFGDWRKYDTKEVNTVLLNNDNVLVRGSVINKDTGISIDISKIGIDHIKVHLHKSDLSNYIINNLHTITQNAILLDTYISEKTSKTKHKNTLFMHSFYIPAEYKNKKIIIKLFVEEYYNDWNDSISRRDYDVKKIEIFNDADRFRENISTPLYASKNTSINNVSELFECVKEYDDKFSPKPVNPAVLNVDGTPKVVYHGTNSGEFWTFDKLKYNSNETSGDYVGESFFLQRINLLQENTERM